MMNIPEPLDDAAYDFVVDAIDTLCSKCHLIVETMKRVYQDCVQHGGREQRGHFRKCALPIYGIPIIAD